MNTHAAGTPARVHADACIDALAARQHGVVSRAQLLEAGVSQHVIEYRVWRRRLHPVFRGVYRVGPLAATHARDMAAVLACGAHAALSHRSAAMLGELLPALRRRAQVDVTVCGGFRAPGAGIRLHRTRAMQPDEIERCHGVPITSPARTLLDLAKTCDVRELERAVSVAEHTGLADREAIRRMLDRYPGRAGAPVLRSLIGDCSTTTRSEAEERFVALVRTAGLRLPEVNVILHGYEVDCLWRAERLIVEIDGYAFHGSRHAFERDRRRDAALMAAGFRVLRVTWRQITRTPAALLVSVTRMLVGAQGEEVPLRPRAGGAWAASAHRIRAGDTDAATARERLPSGAADLQPSTESP